MKIVDGDSHFIEPLDVFSRYIEPAYRERAMRLVTTRPPARNICSWTGNRYD
jgi:hypothetical protein